MAGGRGLPSARLPDIIVHSKAAYDVLTDNIPLHQVETVQVVQGLLGIIRRLKDDVRCALRLELVACSNPDLSDRSVLSKQVIQISSVYLVVPVVSLDRKEPHRFFTLLSAGYDRKPTIERAPSMGLLVLATF